MKLYALKYKDKYIKRDKDSGFIIVPIEKASVFNEKKLGEFEELLQDIKNKNITDIKLVELSIVENENFKGGEVLKSKIKEDLKNN